LHAQEKEFNADLAAYRALELAPTTPQSITRRAATTKLPTKEQLKTFPIHSKLLKGRLNIDAILGMCHKYKIPRLQLLLRLVQYHGLTPKDLDSKFEGSDDLHEAQLTEADVAQLTKDGIITPVDANDLLKNPTRGRFFLFTVAEEAKRRRRCIMWSKEQNEKLRSMGYTPMEIDLDHISAYRAHVENKDRWGAVLDATVAFWQIGIPKPARAFTRFTFKGETFEVNVGSMGHVAMPELMQLIMKIVSGFPGYVAKYEDQLPNALGSVWIDGLFITADSKKHCADAIAHVKNLAKRVNLQFKEEDCTPRREVEFIGVTWNLEHGTMITAPKTLDKIPESCPDQIRADEAEQLIGRLIFAAGVAQVPLVHHYFVMKYFKRICHKLNTGEFHASSVISLKGFAMQSLVTEFCKAVRQVKRPTVVADSRTPAREAHLFTDSTLIGWGAILVLPNGRVLVAGDKFRDGKRDVPIHVREAE
jgi:hypothetical protein